MHINIITYIGDDESASNDILEAVLKAMILMDKVNGSQKDFLEILQYGKHFYQKGHERPPVDSWPSTWQAAMKLLLQNGYKSPIEYYVCLNDSHPCSFDILKTKQQCCRYCNASCTDCIKYVYLPLKDKIARWCSNAKFCHKITAHWTEREHWLHTTTSFGYLP